MYISYNPNPSGKQVGDCVIRGISKITGQSWDDTYMKICMYGYEMKDMPASNQVWESYLVSKGFSRSLIDDACPFCYTVAQFANDHPLGTYLLATGTHVVAVDGGNYYDAWDSGNEVPLYFWRKEQTNGIPK